MNNDKELLDSDGENLAVRTFLMVYGCSGSVEVGRMRDHMEASGWDKCWPSWVDEVADETHLTKGGAQDWLRYLFALEDRRSQPEGWMPIETAPKYTEVLVYRDDSGVFVAKLTTPEAVITPEEMEREDLEFPDDFEEWYSDAYGWQDGDLRPTHWQPLPALPIAAAPDGREG